MYQTLFPTPMQKKKAVWLWETISSVGKENIPFLGDFHFLALVISVGRVGKLSMGYSFGRSFWSLDETKCLLQIRVDALTHKSFLPILCIHNFSSFLLLCGKRWNETSLSRSDLLEQPDTQQNQPMTVFKYYYNYKQPKLHKNTISYNFTNWQNSFTRGSTSKHYHKCYGI